LTIIAQIIPIQKETPIRKYPQNFELSGEMKRKLRSQFEAIKLIIKDN
jgi:hypothetical protein